jgi:hypothetical protein
MTFALALRYWYIIAIAALVAGLGVQTARLVNAKGDLVNARAALLNPITHKAWQSEALRDARDLATCHANVTTLDQALAGQNASIAALKQEADAASARATAAVKAAQGRSADAARQVSALMARKPSGDLCASALELLKEADQ